MTTSASQYPEKFPESTPISSPAPALPHESPLPKQPTPKQATRAGAPRHNTNRATHHLRSERLSGSRLPNGYKPEEAHVQRLGRVVRADYHHRHGRDLEADAYSQTLLLRILRAERSARWAARHLRKQGDALPLADQRMLFDVENAAGEIIDKAMRALGLDTATADDATNPQAALARFLSETSEPTQ